jgi:hypothetical protein
MLRCEDKVFKLIAAYRNAFEGIQYSRCFSFWQFLQLLQYPVLRSRIIFMRLRLRNTDGTAYASKEKNS